MAEQTTAAEAPPKPKKKIEIDVIRAVPPEIGTCTAKECRRRIEWVVTAKNNRRMPVDYPLVVERVHERFDRTLVTVIDAASSHFATCPKAKDFSRRRK